MPPVKIAPLNVVVLAAGKGTRMYSRLPKVLHALGGKPLLAHVLDRARALHAERTIVIYGHGGNAVAAGFADPALKFVLQAPQLGTGHAVRSAEKHLRASATHIMVLYGDHPLIDTKTIHAIADAHLEGGDPLTMATALVDDFDDWREGFYDFGRIVRDKDGKLTRIVERKDATKAELSITEVNPSYFCFEEDWLWKNLNRLTNTNAQGEYYLTSLPEMAQRQGQGITTVSIDPITALGANTPEQLALLERMLAKRRPASVIKQKTMANK